MKKEVINLKIYEVLLESKGTVVDKPQTVRVRYRDVDYNAAWVGARTVCRLGTKGEQRVFKVKDEGSWDDAERFDVKAGIWTVRHIFVQNTRKKGKQRMTTITPEQVISIMLEEQIEMTPELRAKMAEILEATAGLRITVATAKRLGVQPLIEPPSEEEAAA